MDWDAFWKEDPAAAHAAGPSTRSRLRVMLPLLKAFGRRDGSLLDVGCGTGILLENARSLGIFDRLVGVDVSAIPLETARRSCPDASFSVLDICEAALEERFDVITSMMTLDLVEDEESAARHMSEMLAPGGYAIVVVQHHERHKSELDSRYAVRRHDEQSLTKLFQPHGLVPVRIFAWGWPLFDLYYRVLDKSGCGVVGGRTAPSALSRIASRILPTVLRVDDLFVWTDLGRVLFGVLRKPENPASR